MTILEANHIEKYVKDRMLFKAEQLRIEEGDRIGLVGKNGSGKTTLLTILSGNGETDEGSIMTNSTCYLLPQLKETKSNKSGGEVTKEYIDKALMQKADILFADEPTTYLDTDRMEDLENRLKKYRGAIVLVSHDRYFLDQLCIKIWEIENGSVTEYKGNYSSYLDQKELLRKQHEEKYEAYMEKKEQLEKAIQLKERKAAKVTKPSPKKLNSSETREAKPYFAKLQKKMHQNIKALEKRVEKLDEVEKPKKQTAIKMDIPNQEMMKGRTILRVAGLSMQFGKRVLWERASFEIKAGEKTAIIGKNGAGKTTLLKQLMDGRKEVSLSPSVKLGYFSQNLDILKQEQSILDNVMESSFQEESMVRTVLARLHFFREDVFKPVRVLSGGERVKVAFAKVFLSDMNVLVMDEPTNFLDIEALEALESLLLGYEGTILFVSHDRRFIENIATRIIEISNQSITAFDGGYKDFLERNRESKRDFIKDELLQVETKLSEVISKLSERPTEELDLEFKSLIAERKRLQDLKGK